MKLENLNDIFNAFISIYLADCETSIRNSIKNNIKLNKKLNNITHSPYKCNITNNILMLNMDRFLTDFEKFLNNMCMPVYTLYGSMNNTYENNLVIDYELSLMPRSKEDLHNANISTNDIYYSEVYSIRFLLYYNIYDKKIEHSTKPLRILLLEPFRLRISYFILKNTEDFKLNITTKVYDCTDIDNGINGPHHIDYNIYKKSLLYDNQIINNTYPSILELINDCIFCKIATEIYNNINYSLAYINRGITHIKYYYYYKEIRTEMYVLTKYLINMLEIKNEGYIYRRFISYIESELKIKYDKTKGMVIKKYAPI